MALAAEALRKRRRKLRVDEEAHASARAQDAMSRGLGCESKSRADIFRFEIREVAQDLWLRNACGKQLEDVAHADAHAADRRPSAADLGIESDALHGHEATRRRYFLSFFSTSPESAAMNASWGTSTRPTIFMRFLPSFCFSSSLRLRVMSPP